jgi:hypothetical protein
VTDEIGTVIEITAKIESVASVSATVTLSERSYLSDWYRWAALDAAEQASALEEALSAPYGATPKHISLVTSSLFQSVAFMEARANELFQDASDKNLGGRSGGLSTRTRERMAEWWYNTDEGKRSDILLNYQMLLLFSEQGPLDKGTQPYQDAALLIKLRNLLVHFRPESVSSDADKRLWRDVGGKFPANSFAVGLWWPYGCLGAGCAKWGHRSADSLVSDVMARIGLPALGANLSW